MSKDGDPLVLFIQAKDANASIKAKLVYRDEEELDTGVQKVQPLPFLGVCVLM